VSSLVLIAPDPEASISGGNLYNRGLARALAARGVEVRVVALDGARGALAAAPAGAVVLLDSLYLDVLPALRAAAVGQSVMLLAHWLPSLVRHGGVPPREALSGDEQAALAEADAVVVPSAFMARAVAALGAERAHVVEPAVELPPVAGVPEEGALLRAIAVANVVPGKGLLGLVEALRPALVAGAPLGLTIVGSLEPDRAYAEQCLARAAGVAAIRFAGARSHAQALALVAGSDLFVSASRMESYGMALAEARALGVPIVARAGGNVAAHVDERAGGRLVADEAEVAAECLRLAGDRAELARRRAQARAGRPARSWDDAAAELAAALGITR